MIHHASLTNEMMGKEQNKKIVSVNFSCAVFCLLSPCDNLAVRAWFGCMWSIIERSSLVWSGLELHT